MNESPLSLLTDRQRQCLRLSARPMTSKEIAIELGLSHRTVEGHLNGAVQKLGVDSRYAAARMLAESEQAPPYKLPEYPQMLVPGPEKPNIRSSAGHPDRRHDSMQANVMREEQAHFEVFIAPVPRRKRVLGLFEEKSRNDLSIMQRLFVILVLALIWILALTATSVGLRALAS